MLRRWAMQPRAAKGLCSQLRLFLYLLGDVHYCLTGVFPRVNFVNVHTASVEFPILVTPYWHTNTLLDEGKNIHVRKGILTSCTNQWKFMINFKSIHVYIFFCFLIRPLLFLSSAHYISFPVRCLISAPCIRTDRNGRLFTVFFWESGRLLLRMWASLRVSLHPVPVLFLISFRGLSLP